MNFHEKLIYGVDEGVTLSELADISKAKLKIYMI
jgi:hypothetical protein